MASTVNTLEQETRRTTSLDAAVMDVSPLMAEQWLGKNHANRDVRTGHVDRLARDMANGYWRLTGEAIKLDHEGNVLDGQHRLLAIVASQVTVRTLVVFGVDPAARVVMDSNELRKARDVLKALGYTSTKDLAAAAAAMMTYEKLGNLSHNWRGTSWTRTEVVNYVEDHPGLVESVKASATGRRRIPGLTPSAQCALHYIFSRIDEEDNEAFWDQLKSGTNLPAGNPILLLRNRLHANATSTRKLRRVEQGALVVKAWNMWRQGQEAKVLSWRPGGANPEKIPTPV